MKDSRCDKANIDLCQDQIAFNTRMTMDSVIVPVVKNNNIHVNEKGNCRPTCISNIGSDIVEAAL